jgi:hypothetical protein
MPTLGLGEGTESMEGFGAIIRCLQRVHCRIFVQLLRCSASLQLKQAGRILDEAPQSSSNKRIRGTSVRTGSEANIGLVSVSSRTFASTSRSS